MSGYNQHVSRPGALPTWPAASPLNPAGLLQYLHPAGEGYEVYQLPVSRLNGAKAGAVTSGVAQIAGITLTTASSTVGSWAVTVAGLDAPLAVTVAIDTAVTTAANQALAIRDALTAAIAADAALAASVAVAGSGATFGVTTLESAANNAAITITAVKTGVADTTQVAANTAGVLGTIPDFLGQLAIDASTVKVATSVALNTWTAVN